MDPHFMKIRVHKGKFVIVDLVMNCLTICTMREEITVVKMKPKNYHILLHCLNAFISNKLLCSEQ